MAYERTTWENGVTPINAANLNNMEEGIVELDEKLPKKIEKVKLWQNASPASAFAAQTVSLNLSEYDFVLIIYDYSKTAGQRNSIIVPVGNTGIMSIGAGANGSVTSRSANTSLTGVSFDGAYRYTSSSTTTNDYIIPISIYGIKGVQ